MQSSSNRVKFHIELLRLQIALEEKFLRLIPIAGKPVVILCDRGCMDGAAYLSPDEWRQVLDEMNLSEDHVSGDSIPLQICSLLTSLYV